MKKWLIGIVLLVPIPALGQLAALPIQQCLNGAGQALTSGLPSTNYLQVIIPSCTVTLYQTGTTTLATYYLSPTGSPQTGPFTASQTGQWLAYTALNQGVDVVFSGGIPPNTYAIPVTFTGVYPTPTNITGQVFACTYPGADGGAKVNAADAALGSASGTILVNAACGLTWTTEVVLNANHSLTVTDGSTFTIQGITLTQNQTIQGPGTFQAAAYTFGPVNGLFQTYPTGGGTNVASNVVIQNLTLDGNTANTPSPNACYQGHCRDAIEINANNNGVNAVHGITIQNVKFQNWNGEVINVLARTSAGGNSYPLPYDIWILNNNFQGTQSHDILVSGFDHNLVARGNHFQSWGQGQTVAHSDPLLVYDFTNYPGTSQFGLDFSDNTLDNTVISTDGFGFVNEIGAGGLGYVTGYTFSNNHMKDNGTNHGGELSMNALNATVTGNVFSSNCMGEMIGSNVTATDNTCTNGSITIGSGEFFPSRNDAINNNSVSIPGQITKPNSAPGNQKAITMAGYPTQVSFNSQVIRQTALTLTPTAIAFLPRTTYLPPQIVVSFATSATCASSGCLNWAFTLSGATNGGNNGTFIATASTNVSLTFVDPLGVTETPSGATLVSAATTTDYVGLQTITGQFYGTSGYTTASNVPTTSPNPACNGQVTLNLTAVAGQITVWALNTLTPNVCLIGDAIFPTQGGSSGDAYATISGAYDGVCVTGSCGITNFAHIAGSFNGLAGVFGVATSGFVNSGNNNGGGLTILANSPTVVAVTNSSGVNETSTGGSITVNIPMQNASITGNTLDLGDSTLNCYAMEIGRGDGGETGPIYGLTIADNTIFSSTMPVASSTCPAFGFSTSATTPISTGIQILGNNVSGVAGGVVDTDAYMGFDDVVIAGNKFLNLGGDGTIAFTHPPIQLQQFNNVTSPPWGNSLYQYSQGQSYFDNLGNLTLHKGLVVPSGSVSISNGFLSAAGNGAGQPSALFQSGDSNNTTKNIYSVLPMNSQFQTMFITSLGNFQNNGGVITSDISTSQMTNPTNAPTGVALTNAACPTGTMASGTVYAKSVNADLANTSTSPHSTLPSPESAGITVAANGCIQWQYQPVTSGTSSYSASIYEGASGAENVYFNGLQNGGPLTAQAPVTPLAAQVSVTGTAPVANYYFVAYGADNNTNPNTSRPSAESSVAAITGSAGSLLTTVFATNLATLTVNFGNTSSGEDNYVTGTIPAAQSTQVTASTTSYGGTSTVAGAYYAKSSCIASTGFMSGPSAESNVITWSTTTSTMTLTQATDATCSYWAWWLGTTSGGENRVFITNTNSFTLSAAITTGVSLTPGNAGYLLTTPLGSLTTGAPPTTQGWLQTVAEATGASGTPPTINSTGSIAPGGPILLGGSAGTSGQVLTSGGPGAPMTWNSGVAATTVTATGTITAPLFIGQPDPTLSPYAAWSECASSAYAGTAVCNVVLLGDSFMVGGGATPATAGWTVPVEIYLQNQYGYHGSGLIPIYNPYGWTTVNGTWTNSNEIGPYQTATTATYSSVYTATGNANTISIGSATNTFYSDHLVVYYEADTDTASGFNVAFNGGSYTAYGAGTGTHGVLLSVSIAVTAGQNYATLQAPSSGNCHIFGVEWVSGTTGISVHNLSHGGNLATAYGTATSTQLAPELSLIETEGNIGLIVVSLGVNDYATQEGTSTFQTLMQNILTYAGTLSPVPSVEILDEANQETTTYVPAQSAYRAVELGLASAGNSTASSLGWFSIANRWGSWATANAQGYMYSDGIHPDANGYVDIARTEDNILSIPVPPSYTPAGGNLYIGTSPNLLPPFTSTVVKSIGIGPLSLGSQQTTSTGSNTAVGYQACLGVTTAHGSTCVGTFAGGNNLNGGNNNTMIGASAGIVHAGDGNVNVFGANATSIPNASTTNGSNENYFGSTSVTFSYLNGLVKGKTNTQILTADSSGITATTPGTVEFTWGALPISQNYSFSCSGTYTQATGAGGVGISVQGATNAPTRIDAWGSIDTTDPTSTTVTASKGSLANLTSTTATSVVLATPGATGTVYQWKLDGSVQNGTSPTTLNILFYTGNALDAVVIKAGSYCSILP